MIRDVAASPRPLTALTYEDLATGLVLLSTVAITPRWDTSATVSDVVTLAVLVVTVLRRLALRSRARTVSRVRRLAAPLWVLVAAELASALLNGATNWNIMSLAKDLWSIVYLLLPLYLISSRGLRRLPITRATTILGTVLVSALVLADGGPRPSGPFPDPTYTGSWLAVAIVLMWVLPGRKVITMAAVVLAVAAMVEVQSFAALMGAALAVAVASMTSARMRRGLVVAVTVVGLSATMIATGALDTLLGVVEHHLPVGNDAVHHLRYTAGIRFDIWQRAMAIAGDHPLGIGPGGFSAADFVSTGLGTGYETHNTFIEMVVEIGYVGFGAYLWLLHRCLRTGAREPTAMVGLLVMGALFHNIFNFRHIWVGLAVCVAIAGMGSAVSQDRHSQRPERMRV